MNTNKESNYISAVIYANNNTKNLVDFLEKLDNKLFENFKNYELIIVNDSNKVGLSDEIKAVANNFNTPTTSLVTMGYFQGVESSMRAAVDLAIGDFIFEFDYPNHDFDIDLIMEAYQESLKGYDFVACINEQSQKESKLFYTIFNKFGTFDYRLKSETFRVLSRRGINRVESLNATIPYRKAVYASSGLRSSTISYSSKVTNSRDSLERKNRSSLAIDSILMFTDFGYKISTAISLTMALFAIITTIYTIGVFITGRPVQGWTTMMLLLSFGFLGMFVIFTFLIKYCTLIIRLLFKRHEYVVSGVEKIKNSK